MKEFTISQSHENIFKTYQELQRVLPNGFLKMKVFKNQKYPISKSSIIKEIEKNYNKKNIKKRIFSSSQNINIFYNENEVDKNKIKILPKLKNGTQNDQNTDMPLNITNSQKSNNNKTNIFNYNNNSEIITYRNFREKNMKMIGVSCDMKLKRNKGLYNSCSVNDIDMKKNIYLPRIIDRMKYSIPRNLRNNKGFIIKGNNAHNILDKYKKLNFIKFKNDMPTDMFFYNESKKQE